MHPSPCFEGFPLNEDLLMYITETSTVEIRINSQVVHDFKVKIILKYGRATCNSLMNVHTDLDPNLFFKQVGRKFLSNHLKCKLSSIC